MLRVKIEVTGPRASGKTHASAVIIDGLRRSGYTVTIKNRDMGQPHIGDDHPWESIELELKP